MLNRKEITLALGGGGVKGCAHAGVLRVLERQGYSVRAIAGTSAGGLWGSLYAYGYSPDEIQRCIKRLDPETVFERREQDGPAWMGLSGVTRMLEDALGDCTFEELRMPFAVTAVDIHTAEYVVLRSGRVVDAVLATIAVPGLLPPRKLDGHTLVDGGLLDQVPVTLARSLAPHLPVVAVVLSPAIDQWGGIEQPGILNIMPLVGMLGPFSEYLGRWRVTQALNILVRAADISSALTTELLLEIEKPDIIIRPAVPQLSLLDRVDADHLSLMGERAAERSAPDLERVSGLAAWLRRRLVHYRPPMIRPPIRADFPDFDLLPSFAPPDLVPSTPPSPIAQAKSALAALVVQTGLLSPGPADTAEHKKTTRNGSTGRMVLSVLPKPASPEQGAPPTRLDQAKPSLDKHGSNGA